ncbi:type II toxin-antitoxin system RelE/ParE family toxin [Lacihabitans sp. LS3-19]|uniref:type II toxin-antitoxin system RelE/ParE family toxin n=1 Tax=Lacihabitans sp. LS3-19 TaxID=2487335 RepID=UPI0020CC4CC0|nr:type II toxin-antitoxin system RelE/ParE family toxin [Lacihabitans sp. LS3-19]MCP9768121.1 type II toxin-antitoxin system RelE/ParE family toxin [Lacihabitans sp. LS3-19]
MARFQVILEPKAEIDIEEAFDYYLKFSEKLAIRILQEIENKLEIISDIPEAFQVRYKEFRTISLKKFPYMIHYFVDSKSLEIHILAVLHTSVNTDKWL